MGVFTEGRDERAGLTAADASAITIFKSGAAGQTLLASIQAFATAYTSGSPVYTLTYTRNAQAISVSTTAIAAVNTPESVEGLIHPDAATAVTVQLTGAFVGTVDVTATLVQQL